MGAFEKQVLPPYEVLIHPSSACNLCCEWCIGDHVPIVSKNRVVDAAKTMAKRLPDALAVPENMMRLVRGIVAYKKVVKRKVNGECLAWELRVENVCFSGSLENHL